MIIYKYPLIANGRSFITLELPWDAVPLSFQMQNDIPTLWVEMKQTTANLVKRTFLCVGTGISFEGKWNYIGTTQDGGFVWHLYEEIQ